MHEQGAGTDDDMIEGGSDTPFCRGKGVCHMDNILQGQKRRDCRRGKQGKEEVASGKIPAFAEFPGKASRPLLNNLHTRERMKKKRTRGGTPGKKGGKSRSNYSNEKVAYLLVFTEGKNFGDARVAKMIDGRGKKGAARNREGAQEGRKVRVCENPLQLRKPPTTSGRANTVRVQGGKNRQDLDFSATKIGGLPSQERDA